MLKKLSTIYQVYIFIILIINLQKILLMSNEKNTKIKNQ
jgi:hypothetical protein